MSSSVQVLFVLLICKEIGVIRKINCIYIAGYGRNIQPLPCATKEGDTGVCMFAWDCMKANGTHLGTCIERYVTYMKTYT